MYDNLSSVDEKMIIYFRLKSVQFKAKFPSISLKILQEKTKIEKKIRTKKIVYGLISSAFFPKNWNHSWIG